MSIFSSIVVFIFCINNVHKFIFEIIGLIIGEIISATVAIRICKKINEKFLYIVIGNILIILNVHNIIEFLL